MFSGEISRGEEFEAEQEKNPEQVLNNAVSAIESRDATDPIMAQVKEFLNSRPKIQFGIDAGRVGVLTCAKIVWGLLKFTKEAIVKKGKVGFGKAYEIGKEALSFEKKDKK